MAVTRKKLVAGVQLTGTAATYYTAPASTRTLITACTLTNTTAGAVSVTLSLGTDAAGTRVLSARSIAAGETYSVVGAVGQMMEAAEVLQASGLNVSLMVSGIEFV